MRQSPDALIALLDTKRSRYLGSRSERLKAHPFATIAGSLLGRITNRWGTNRPLVRTVRLFTGERMTISVPPYLELLLSGAYASHDPEVRLTKWLFRTLKEGDVFVDCGAHYGYYTVIAAPLVGETGKVVAIEPSPLVLPYLRQNVERNENATLVEAGISDSVGTATFYESDLQYSVISTLNPKNLDQIDHLGGIAREVTVKTTTLDALDVAPTVIKLDVEGAETAALRGGADTIAAHKPAIALEVFLRPTDNDRSALVLLETYGYVMHAIDGDGRLHKIAYDDLDKYLADRKRQYDAVHDDAIIDNLIFLR